MNNHIWCYIHKDFIFLYFHLDHQFILIIPRNYELGFQSRSLNFKLCNIIITNQAE